MIITVILNNMKRYPRCGEIDQWHQATMHLGLGFCLDLMQKKALSSFQIRETIFGKSDCLVLPKNLVFYGKPANKMLWVWTNSVGLVFCESHYLYIHYLFHWITLTLWTCSWSELHTKFMLAFISDSYSFFCARFSILRLDRLLHFFCYWVIRGMLVVERERTALNENIIFSIFQYTLYTNECHCWIFVFGLNYQSIFC